LATSTLNRGREKVRHTIDVDLVSLIGGRLALSGDRPVVFH